MFKIGKELQKKVVPLSNMYGNKLDNLVNNSDKKIIKWLIKNIKSPQIQLGQSEDRIASNFVFEKEEMLKKMIENEINITIFTQRS